MSPSGRAVQTICGMASASWRNRRSLLPQGDLGPLPLAHVPEVDGQAVRRRVGVDLVPAVVRRVERLERDGDVLGHRPAVAAVEVGPHGGGELLPDVLPQQVVPGPAQQDLGLPVDVGEPPVPAQAEEGVGDALQDRPGPLLLLPQPCPRPASARSRPV